MGIFLIQLKRVENCTYISCHQLYQTYNITNQYLTEGKSEFLHHDISSLSKSTGEYNYRNILYFDIDPFPNRHVDAILSLIILLALVLEFWRHSRRSRKSFLVSLLILLLLRSVSLVFDATEILFRYDIFNPIKYTSSVVNPTLGDLLLNCIIIFILVLASAHHLQSLRKSAIWVAVINGINTAIAGMMLHVSWSIVSNSQLSLDVGESIQFDLLRNCCLLIYFDSKHKLFLLYLPGTKNDKMGRSDDTCNYWSSSCQCGFSISIILVCFCVCGTH